jgi:hypothetical protein
MAVTPRDFGISAESLIEKLAGESHERHTKFLLDAPRPLTHDDESHSVGSRSGRNDNGPGERADVAPRAVGLRIIDHFSAAFVAVFAVFIE